MRLLFLLFGLTTSLRYWYKVYRSWNEGSELKKLQISLRETRNDLRVSRGISSPEACSAGPGFVMYPCAFTSYAFLRRQQCQFARIFHDFSEVLHSVLPEVPCFASSVYAARYQVLSVIAIGLVFYYSLASCF